MMFLTGMHHPHNAAKVPAAFISAHALRRRKGGFPVRRWVLDGNDPAEAVRYTRRIATMPVQLHLLTDEMVA